MRIPRLERRGLATFERAVRAGEPVFIGSLGAGLVADELVPLPTNTALGHQTTRAGVTFRYPLILPGDAPTFRPGDTLVLAGSGLSGWSVAPLVPSPSVETPIEAGAASFARRNSARTVRTGRLSTASRSARSIDPFRSIGPSRSAVRGVPHGGTKVSA